jgi:uncharacterized repeat protein (TIGR01451 family)
MSPTDPGTYCVRLEYHPDATALYSEGLSTSTTNECFTVIVLHPSIDIQKTPDTQTVLTGTKASFTITVKNTGDSQLTNVTVSDPNSPGCDQVIGTLAANDGAPGGPDEFSYSCDSPTLTQDLHNVANVSGHPAAGPDVTDSDDADVTVINPGIAVEKGPNWQSVVSGNTVTFSITVTNTGDSTLTDVHVTDAQAPNCERTAAQIAADPNAPNLGTATFHPTDSYSYQCTLSVTQTLTNTAQACGTPAAGPDACDTDDANVGLEHQSSYPDFVPNDFADLSVDGSDVPQNGQLTFALYKGACTGTPLFSQTVDVNGPGSYQTNNLQLLSVLLGSTNTGGTYNWQITYSGDTNGNSDINGACGTEHFTITTGADAP